MKNENVNEHLIHVLDKTTPYQRMVWLKKVFEFWKKTAKQKKSLKGKVTTS